MSYCEELAPTEKGNRSRAVINGVALGHWGSQRQELLLELSRVRVGRNTAFLQNPAIRGREITPAVDNFNSTPAECRSLTEVAGAHTAAIRMRWQHTLRRALVLAQRLERE